MTRLVALCLAAAIAASAVRAEPWQAPRLYDEGLDLGGPYVGQGVEGHPPGYFPTNVSSRTVLQPLSGGRFRILVTPNLVGYSAASARAAAAAKRHCGPGTAGIAAVIDEQARYAEASLESWSFTGRCR